MKILGTRVLIKPDPKKDKTESGLYIPERAQENSTTGTVIEVGPGTKNYEMSVKKGDRVMFGKYGGTELQVENETMYLLNETEITGILTN